MYLISKKQNVTHVELDNEFIVLDPTTQSYFSLNPVGVTIWSLLDKPGRLVEEVIEYLMHYYHIEREIAAKDTMTFIQTMIHHQILVVEPCDKTIPANTSTP